MLKVWIVGSEGQIGEAINEVLDPLEIEVLNTDKNALDITETDEVLHFGEINRPDVIINCAAITDVELCEKQPEEAFRVNALGARNLSLVARKIGAKMVQLSTDDVFDGLAQKPYTEFDNTNPKTVYGKSKCAGENYVKEFTHKHFIIRSNWVFGKGNNFVNRVLEAADQMQDNSCQILCAGRRAKLVGCHCKRPSCLRCIKYFCDEIIPSSIDPVAPDDEMLMGKLLYIVFPGSFRAAVHCPWIGIVKLAVGSLAHPVKYVVGRQLDHLSPYFARHDA